MKPTFLQRARDIWLGLPQGIRPGAVAVAAIVLMLVLLALWPRAARAEAMRASNGADTIRLLDQPCSSQQVLDRLAPRFRDRMRDATATVGGQDYRACWLVDGDSAHLLYEDGDQGLIELRHFKPDGA